MATLADSLKTSSGRRLALKKRPDLSAEEQRYQGRAFWVVKEPVGLKYYRFQEEEYAILEMIDGQISLDEMKRRFESRFAPQKITLGDLQHFVGTLHRNGLVVADAPGQGRQLKRRRDERKSKERMGKVSNILAIRFKGFDPEGILNWLHPWVKWFFTRWCLTLCLTMAFVAMSLILVQWNTFQSRLPAFEEFFGPSNWFWLAVVLGLTKVLHEFGHGLACKHFGGECHEIGVMLLVLTPCLYCNVSDSWMLRSKWKRAAIGAAGMYVEVVLATLATFVWWFSEPGMLNHLALRIMFVCSVSTVLFNGNPLLRYDGYYILSDLVEIPNLRQKSTQITNRILSRVCLGLELPEEPFLPQRNHAFFAFYTIASIFYRWFILFSILFFLYKVFEPYGLQVIGQTIAAFSIGSLVVKPLYQCYKFLKTPGRWDQVKRLNLYATLTVVGLIVAGILMIPLPRRVMCTLEIQPRQSEAVFVDVPGQLDEVLVKPGDQVSQGQVLARIQNIDLQIAIDELVRQRNELKSQLASLGRQRYENRRAGQQIPQMRETLAAVETQIVQKSQDLKRLELLAPKDGTILQPMIRPEQPQPDGTLSSWSGSLLDNRNLGATLSASELFCEVGDPRQLEAVLIIDQTDIELVREHKQVGQDVSIKLDAFPSKTFDGQILEISRSELKEAPRSLSNQAGGELATVTDSTGASRPMSTSYTARVPLDHVVGSIQVGLRGRAKIHTGWQPLGGRIWRYLSHTFHFWL